MTREGLARGQGSPPLPWTLIVKQTNEAVASGLTSDQDQSHFGLLCEVGKILSGQGTSFMQSLSPGAGQGGKDCIGGEKEANVTVFNSAIQEGCHQPRSINKDQQGDGYP